jgi:hypothetical protein
MSTDAGWPLGVVTAHWTLGTKGLFETCLLGDEWLLVKVIGLVKQIDPDAR